MKVDSNNFDTLDRIFSHGGVLSNLSHARIAQDTEIIDNGYSSMVQKELNNHIGILQIARNALQNIINNSQITLNEVNRELENAQFRGYSVFRENFIVQDSDNAVLFDSSRIMDSKPSDERDLYGFKKTLKIELESLQNTLDSLKVRESGESSVPQTQEIVSYLAQNAQSFANAHDTRGLAHKLDALLS